MNWVDLIIILYSPEGKDVEDRYGLMDSPGHRRNILDPAFAKIGIGVIDGGVYGKMTTQLFTD